MKFAQSSLLLFVILSFSSFTSPAVIRRQDIKETRRLNALDAIALNKSFESLASDSTCDPTTQANACVKGEFAQCSGGKFVSTKCNTGLTCAAVPLVNKRGTSILCDTAADRDARINDALGTPPPKP
ncbi:4152_t:CDS:2 [Ambispora gerdemannii]|uniref:4152_t:CDS:1 n=1 Tax=Ambispora gerdemannii TaxID=144530 RepID=A0A9N9GLZ0_9GLOM|nr:4152_t:CDS:2 [Ambispora gerdemannii]